jgi:hypothetical protein
LQQAVIQLLWDQEQPLFGVDLLQRLESQPLAAAAAVILDFLHLVFHTMAALAAMVVVVLVLAAKAANLPQEVSAEAMELLAASVAAVAAEPVVLVLQPPHHQAQAQVEQVYQTQ